MAPPTPTEDYYIVLEVDQTATLELITRSYKRLALKLHPDRNDRHDATEAFQLLGRAYETLKDESLRRAYDLLYPSIKKTHHSPPRSSPTTASQSEALSEAAQIAALQISKQERSARWWIKKNAFDSSIFELQRAIRRLEQEIKNLDSIIAAVAAEEAGKNSWTAWLLSPLYKKVEDSQEEKERKDRHRQERRIEKDMKERRLILKKEDLKKEESLLSKAKEEVDAADMVDNRKIQLIRGRISARETRERQEREQAERERKRKIWKQQQEQREKQEREAAEALRKWQQEQWKREAAEALRKQQEEQAEQKRHEEQIRQRQKVFEEEVKKYREQYARINSSGRSAPQANTSTCRHDGWWPKVQGRTACPECHEIWTYLLQCPGCKMKTCPRCQAALRPRIQRNIPRANQRAPPRVRTPSPASYFDYY